MSGLGPDAAGFEPPPSVDGEPVGSLAEEAFKLFRAVSPGGAVGDTAEHVCSTAWCPVCQVVGFVRENPEAIDTVRQSAVGLARSLRDLVDAAFTPQPSQEDQ
ncbi:MAG: hypothetical protein ABW075_09180 [Aeromicrobium sp.]